ncbi:protein O-glucosyltransferase 1-like isoform X2 [Benincasa hispida]|uniref:protein O-glucosyltransferase 1-like isoform X2 n=1 Tax=Benincasa hispida TaxID=102211 RepID=UPI001901221D|nr:protein O-glucosyltransferase 1-like isoform X2 [Benincasa hispida]
MIRGDDSRRKFQKHLSGDKLLHFLNGPHRSSVIIYIAVVFLVGMFLSGRLLSLLLGLKSNLLNQQPEGQTKQDPDRPTSATCPEYFRWIHGDLRPWAGRGITKTMLEEAQKKAHFRLVVVEGKAYMEAYGKAYQSRDNITLWGVVQLLRRYPGKLPDLDLMFNCDDRPEIYQKDYTGPEKPSPPPLFGYSGDDATYDIVFPDWSFWGWPEINIKPWESILKDIKEGKKKTEWMKREPYAYWKGNPSVAYTRRDLLKCNVTHKQDWNARLYRQNWDKESKAGFKDSNLANQCVYRSLIPLKHYWPISSNRKCSSIKFAVDWGNIHHQKAMDIGKAASKFIEEELKMEYIYDYMFHLLNQYSKLLTFKPTVPPNATELSSESMTSAATGSIRKSMTESAVTSPADSEPCALQPPYDPQSLQLLFRSREDSIKQVEKWERSFSRNGQIVQR